MQIKMFFCPYCGEKMSIVYARPEERVLTECRLKCTNNDCETLLTISHLHNVPDRQIVNMRTSYTFGFKEIKGGFYEQN